MTEAYCMWFCSKCGSSFDTEEEANACCVEEEPEPEEEGE